MPDGTTCSVPGCDKPLRSPGADWCAMHYHRWYRHGSVEKVAAKVRPQFPRYRQTMRHGHPIAGKSGKVYVHRLVLFETIGPGTHPCHWCCRQVSWDLPKGQPDALQADHLNHDRLDNRPENLVPACGPCNTARGCHRRHELLVSLGFWSNNDTVAALKPRIGGRSPAAPAGQG